MLLLRVRLTSAPLAGLVTFCQIYNDSVRVIIPLYASIAFATNTFMYYCLRVLLFFSGIWNLIFFESFLFRLASMPDSCTFCLYCNLHNHHIWDFPYSTPVVLSKTLSEIPWNISLQSHTSCSHLCRLIPGVPQGWDKWYS